MRNGLCSREAHYDSWSSRASLKTALSKPQIVEEYVKKLGRTPKTKHDLHQGTWPERETLLRQIESKELDTIDAYRAGSLSSAELAKSLDELARRKKAPDSSQKQLWASSPAPIIKRTLSEYCRKVNDSMENASPTKRQQILRLLISEIIFEGFQARIIGALSADEGSEESPFDLNDPAGTGSNVGITAPTSRRLDRNPHKMEFEIVAPIPKGYFKEAK
jgi:hypothetical protein